MFNIKTISDKQRAILGYNFGFTEGQYGELYLDNGFFFNKILPNVTPSMFVDICSRYGFYGKLNQNHYQMIYNTLGMKTSDTMLVKRFKEVYDMTTDKRVFKNITNHIVGVEGDITTTPISDELIDLAISAYQSETGLIDSNNNLNLDAEPRMIVELLPYAIYFNNWKDIFNRYRKNMTRILMSQERFEEICSDANETQELLEMLIGKFITADSTTAEQSTALYMLDTFENVQVEQMLIKQPSFIFALSDTEQVVTKARSSQVVSYINIDDIELETETLVKLLDSLSKTLNDVNSISLLCKVISKLGVEEARAEMTKVNKKWFDLVYAKITKFFKGSYVLKYANDSVQYDKTSNEELPDDVLMTDCLEYIVDNNIVDIDIMLDIFKSYASNVRNSTFHKFVLKNSERYPTIVYMYNVYQLGG